MSYNYIKAWEDYKEMYGLDEKSLPFKRFKEQIFFHTDNIFNKEAYRVFTLKDLQQLQWEKDCSKTKMPKEYVPKTKFSDKTANGLEKAIVAYITLMGGMAERRKNSGRVIDDRKIVTDVLGKQRVLGGTRYIPGTGKNGTSDVSGIYKGKPVAIEVKIGRDKQSEAQKEYQLEFEKAGGVYIIAKELEQFVKDLEEGVL